MAQNISLERPTNAQITAKWQENEAQKVAEGLKTPSTHLMAV
ncbi:hypothetical protein P4S68_21495 [Pseudoalteromonas sp. Hal099]